MCWYLENACGESGRKRQHAKNHLEKLEINVKRSLDNEIAAPSTQYWAGDGRALFRSRRCIVGMFIVYVYILCILCTGKLWVTHSIYTLVAGLRPAIFLCHLQILNNTNPRPITTQYSIYNVCTSELRLDFVFRSFGTSHFVEPLFLYAIFVCFKSIQGNSLVVLFLLIVVFDEQKSRPTTADDTPTTNLLRLFVSGPVRVYCTLNLISLDKQVCVCSSH